jgi:hypothetical protein
LKNSRSIALGLASVGRREGSHKLRLRVFFPWETHGKNGFHSIRAMRELCEAL